MHPRRLLPPAAIALAATAAIAAPGAARADTPAAASDAQLSSNWAGYTVTGQGFSKVSGTWTQPEASCESGQGDAAFWVGIGGASQGSSALEQAGTEVNCDAGTPTYSAWYELVPAAPVAIDMAVEPGDTISTTVGVDGDQVSISMTNETTGKSFGRTLRMDNPDTTSAEWIAEAPSACQGGVGGACQTVALADFDSVTFTHATATEDGHTGSIGDAAWQATPMQLQPGDGSPFGGGRFGGNAYGDATSTAGAIPSTLTSDGAGFTVAWQGGGDAQQTTTPGQGQDPAYGSDPYGDGGWGSQGGWGGDTYGWGADGGPAWGYVPGW